MTLPLDRDAGIVELQGIGARAKPTGERRPQCDGGMAAECDLAHRCEVAHPPARALWCGKGGLGIADLGRDALHLFLGGHLVGDHHAGRVSAQGTVGKGGDPVHMCCHVNSSCGRGSRQSGTLVLS